MKETIWVGRSLEDLRAMPESLKQDVGLTLRLAQNGEQRPEVKSLGKYRETGVLEVVEQFDRDIYRAVFTVRFETAIYVLHCFNKKSKKAGVLPRPDVRFINSPLKLAVELEQERMNERNRRLHHE